MRTLLRHLLSHLRPAPAAIPPDTAGLARHDARGKPLTVSQYQQIWAHPPSFAAFLPWVDWLDGDRCLLLEDGHSVSAVYELTPFTTEGRKEARLAEIRDQVEDALQNSFDGLEEKPWVIQFFCQDERDPQAWIAHIRDYIRPAARDTPFTGAWLEQMTRHLTVVARDGGLFEDTLVTGTAWQGRRRRVRMVVGRLTGASESTRRTPAQMLNQTCQRFTAALAGAGVPAHRLGAVDIYLWLVQWFNPGNDRAFYQRLADRYRTENHAPGLLPFARDFGEDVLACSPVSDVDNGVWWLNDRAHRVLVAERLTDPPPPGALTGERQTGDHIRAAFDELPEGSILALTAIAIPQEPLEKNFTRLERNAIGDNAAARAVQHDAKEAIRWLAARHRLWKMNLSFFISAPDLAGLREREDTVTTTLSRHGIAVLQPENLVAPLNAWLRVLPGCFSPADDPHGWYSQLAFVQHIAGLLPVFGRATGTGHPGMTFFNRGGEPLHVDPLNKADRGQNAHMLLFGPTGAGKSATLNALFAQMMAVHRPRLYIIEAGNSFGLFADYATRYGLTVRRVSIRPGSGVILPPFPDAHLALDASPDLPPDDADKPEEDDEKRDVLGEMEIAAQLMITGGEPREVEKYTRADRGLVRRALYETAQRCVTENRAMLPADLRATLLTFSITDSLHQKARDRAADMASCLDLFTSGFEGEVFNRPGETWQDADVTLVDLAHFAREGYEAQMAMAVIALTNHINSLGEREQHSDRDLIYAIDEAHLITANALLSPFVTKASKMWRKLGIWLWLATQNMEDYPATSAKMLNMCEFWMCLVMPPKEVEEIARFRTLSDEQKQMLLSARKLSGAYTEGVLLAQNHQSLFRVVTPSLYLALGQTEKDEKAARRRLMDTHGCSELDAALMIAAAMDLARGLVPREAL
ncbi:conjugative transfer ATPase [Klebsiella variicola]|uniref:conjugative transfer ATPase n=1 Tax=Klebsiella variicola TaxID=244366 RepID=UPI001C94047C|nr:conjugative transfer ATPase [Klebsiella variicola]MBY5172959.1 conjugative transfer ATPase [Klebsiella variicola]